MKNLTISQLIHSTPETFEAYFTRLRWLQGKDYISTWPVEMKDPYRAKLITEMSFGQVSKMKRKINTIEGIIWCICQVYGIEANVLMQMRAKDFFHAFNWIRAELQAINAREAKYLGGEVDPYLALAGVDKLEKFKELNVLFALGKEYGVPPTQVEEWKYTLVFTLMYHGRISEQVNKRYAEVLRGKK